MATTTINNKFALPAPTDASKTVSYNNNFSQIELGRLVRANAEVALSIGQAVYVDASGNWQLASDGTPAPRFVCVQAAAGGAVTYAQIDGTITLGTWSWTVGAPIYVSNVTPGLLTSTKPQSSSVPLAIALTATEILLQPYLTGLVVAANIPTAGVIDFAGTTAPTGYLFCDGSAVSRTTYAGIFAVTGTTFGVGDGSTTFNLPDTRGRTSIGAGTGAGLTARTVGQTGGEETHVLTTAELAVHAHGLTDPGHTHGVGGSTSSSGSGTTSAGNTTSQISASATTGITEGNAGSGSGHNNMPPFLVLQKIIKT